MFGKEFSFIVAIFLIPSLFVFVCADSMLSASKGGIPYAVSLINSAFPSPYLTMLKNISTPYLLNIQNVLEHTQLNIGNISLNNTTNDSSQEQSQSYSNNINQISSVFKSLGYPIVWYISLALIIVLSSILLLLNLKLTHILPIFGGILLLSGLLILLFGPKCISNLAHSDLGLSSSSQNNPFIFLLDEAMFANGQIFVLFSILLFLVSFLVKAVV